METTNPVARGRCQRSPLIAALLWSLALGGCSESLEPQLPLRHPVQGKVIYRGQPASGFRVTFHPLQDIGQLKFAPSAITEKDGSFRLRSYEPDDGAPLGDYVVTLEWPDHLIQADDPDPKPEVDRLRGAYSDPRRSQIKVTVTAGQNELQSFVLR
jgi:hypothetical protein